MYFVRILINFSTNVLNSVLLFFFVKQKTAYEMRISDWSSDVCSSELNESLATKERESRDAYEFIDSQVQQYHAKLTEAEANLEQYRRKNPDARPGIDADVNARIGELRRQIESSRKIGRAHV